MPRLLEKYKKDIIPHIMQKFGFKNRLQVPRLKKIVINMGLGAAAHDAKLLEQATADLALITGQRPVITKARKAISNFKIRKGSKLGCKVTLRGRRMYEFLDRLVNVALPRIRDFRGFSQKSFDGQGNYSLGINEQTIFPEIDIDKTQRLQGMDITIVTTTENQELARELLKEFNFPFMNHG
ncbi:MAG: 50S ribosomal protein L5 [Candidatus Omnitrophota bacterium]|nr:MAG: 50S ribosomal protein L5 [Candidatus Omnitrophota bacterium]